MTKVIQIHEWSQSQASGEDDLHEAQWAYEPSAVRSAPAPHSGHSTILAADGSEILGLGEMLAI